MTDELDLITVEVLRHRLWEINNEIGVLASRMAGSPAVYESGDYNTSIMSAEGKGLFSGVGVIRQGTILDLVVRSVMTSFAGSIEADDVFLTNDPFAGALHAMDVAVVAPVFARGTLVAWTGIVFHELDVGGARAGSWSVGARDAYQEPPLIPPLRVVRGGQLVGDAEAVFLRNSRVPDVLGINLHAKIAAQMLARDRIREIVDSIGVDAFLALEARLLDDVRVAFRSRLAELPDGQWVVNAFLDHDGVSSRVYELVMRATKEGERLLLDFTGTSRQASGPINCAWSGLVGGVLEVLVPAFCFDVPWAHGAVLDCVEIESEKGTVNNAEYPAPTSMATVNACQSTSDLVWQVVAQMYGWSARYRSETMALGYSGVNSGTLSGRWDSGAPFVLSCSGLGGGGARADGDGIDSSGNVIAPIFAIPNVERMERLAPILVVGRRERPDTGGPGRWRGGLGVEFIITPHNAMGAIQGSTYATGFSEPEARGVFGGLPGSVQSNVIVRDTEPLELLEPGVLDGLRFRRAGVTTNSLEAKATFALDVGDAWISIATGGGGLGDPLEREAERVLDDVLEGRCSADDARGMYGVVVDGRSIDQAATRKHRTALRRRRLRQAVWRRRASGRVSRVGVRGDQGPRSFTLQLADAGNDWAALCVRCGTILGRSAGQAKAGAAVRDVRIANLCIANRLIRRDDKFVREFLCPGCGVLWSAEVVGPKSELQDGLVESVLLRTPFRRKPSRGSRAGIVVAGSEAAPS